MQKFSPMTPDDIAPMPFDFATFLAEYGDTIATASVTAEPSTLSDPPKYLEHFTGMSVPVGLRASSIPD